VVKVLLDRGADMSVKDTSNARHLRRSALHPSRERRPGRIQGRDRRTHLSGAPGGTGGSFSASPVAADGKIYLSSEDGDVFVVNAGPTYELLAKNPIGEVLMATRAISDGLFIFRGLKNVCAIKAR
jgi:outer membrane protein assembly factor BamB